jgi:lysozyme family protein
MANFDESVQWVLDREGRDAYTNYPGDPGGETKWGISKRYHPKLDIKNLTEQQAIEIYRTEYWNAAMCDSLPDDLALAVFDCAVNPGVGIALKMMTECNGTVEDYCLRRISAYVDIIAKSPKMSGNFPGWIKRVILLYKHVTAVEAE